MIATAIQIHQITEKISTQHSELPQPLRIGAGIHSGKASVDIGVDNTALGDTVNTAFRLESSSKELACDIVISRSCYQLLPPQHWEHKEQITHVKGKKEPVSVIGLSFTQLNNLVPISNIEPATDS